MIYFIFFLLLAGNLIFRFIKKGGSHMKLLKYLNLANSKDSYSNTFMTGTFYKYPTLMIPYIERFENLEGESLKLYIHAKSQLRLLWYSIFLLVCYCLLLVFIGE